MSRTRVVLRERADRDVDEAIAYYLQTGSPETATGFVDALETAFEHRARHPAAGSTRLGVELNIPGLRVWPVKAHPYLLLYLEHETWLDVWRVLHGQRDVPASLRDRS